MKQKYIVSILLLSIALYAFWPFGQGELDEWEKKWQAEREAYQEYIVYVNEVRQAFAEKMFKELNLVYSGGRGVMHGKAEEIGMKFRTNRRATIEEARALHLYVMEKFVEAINAHEKLRPFLEEYPFTYQRVMIYISFNNPIVSYPDGGVYYLSNTSGYCAAEKNRNHLYYRSYDPFTEKLLPILREPYEVAVQRALETPVLNPHVHKTTAVEEAVDEVLSAFVKEMKEKHRFLCLSIGANMEDQLKEVGVTFNAFQHATQEEARQVILATKEKLLQAINSCDKLKPYLAESPFSVDRLKIRIGFRTEKRSKYRDGSMESVTLEDNTINYYQEVPIGAKIIPVRAPLFASETYEEAMSYIKGAVPAFGITSCAEKK